MTSKSNSFSFQQFEKETYTNLISKRDGETKLGERLASSYLNKEVKYVILGISEDIGPQANLGLNGSTKAFTSFLTRFLNCQSNRFLTGDNIFILGEIKSIIPFDSIENARKQIEELDDFVISILQPIIKEGKIPIVIGGGHNNAFPLIKVNYLHNSLPLDIINLDPHADCRAIEGRHSGNPFSYAKELGFLKHYTVLGLHQQYNSESIYNYLDQHKFDYSFFEDYLDLNSTLREDIQNFINKKTQKIGIELDLDSIKMIPSSAFTPSGFSIEEARIYIRELAKVKNCAYIHFPEGAPKSEIDEKVVGKMLSYLVTDFIKINSSSSN
jgi:formiminoglutamase